MKAYYYCLISILLLASCVEEAPETSGLPDVKLEIADSGTLVFEMKGNLPSNMSGKITECGFYVSENSSLQDAEKFTSKLTGSSFAANVTLKGYDKTYYAAAFISNGRSEVLSKLGTCKVRQLSEYVTFQETAVSGYDRQTETATLSIPAVEVKKGVNPSKYGVIYGTSTNLEKEGTTKELFIPSAGESVSFDLTGLQIGTQYYICQFINDGNAIAYSPKQTLNVFDVPVVEIGNITDITPSSATVEGSISDTGGKEVTEWGVVYVEGNQTPTIDTGNTIAQGSANNFKATITGLLPKQLYSVRTYAKNSEGIAYSTQTKQFTTLVGPPSVTTEEATSISGTSATLNATITSDGGEAITDCGFYWSTSPSFSIESAQKVKGNIVGNRFSASLSNLTIGTDYYFQAYLTNTTETVIGIVLSFKTSEMPTVRTEQPMSISSKSAVICGTIIDDGRDNIAEFGFYLSTYPSISLDSAQKIKCSYIQDLSFSTSVSDLDLGTDYYYKAFATNSSGSSFGESIHFTTLDYPTVTISSITNVTDDSATIKCNVSSDGGSTITERGVVYIKGNGIPSIENGTTVKKSGTTGSYDITLSNLPVGTRYSVRAYAINDIGTAYSDTTCFTTKTPYTFASANCFIVSESGTYRFKTVKGNSSTSVGDVYSAQVLWESFGTSIEPSKGDLIKTVSYSNGYIAFCTNNLYKKGNAVIAAKDKSGDILWSWHIWFTDQPQEQEYYNDAGVMMDRNLGAITVIPDEEGRIGLYYQWGRKDPFLGYTSMKNDPYGARPQYSKSTLSWPSAVSSSSSTGTIDYTIKHPTTFITYNDYNRDWYYNYYESTDDTRWQSDKTIYDPCPTGWRVPDGGPNGVWATAVGTDNSFERSWYYEDNCGHNFSNVFGSAPAIVYPSTGYLSRYDGQPQIAASKYNIYGSGYYWSTTTYNIEAHYLYCTGIIYPSSSNWRANGYVIRCIKE